MTDKTAKIYFERYAWPRRLFPEYTPSKYLNIGIVLPAFNEPEIEKAINAITNCIPPQGQVVLLVIINESESCDSSITLQNQKTIAALDGFDLLPSWLELKYTYLRLPQKKAGVGLARKIGMDEVAFWFNNLSKNGIIVCFDADSTCSENYLQEIELAFFQQHHKACISYYEHPLNIASGVIEYELHLRYYIDALRFAGYPRAFQTLGSCISVDSETYIQCGGMNTRKAGEDFYFLHQIALFNDIHEINTVSIFPSDRLSERVPFGTGKALQEYRSVKKLLTYSIQTFLDIESYLAQTQLLLAGEKLKLSPQMNQFLQEQNFDLAWIKMEKQAGKDIEKLEQLFFNWWNGFRMLKYIHFRRDAGDAMIDPTDAIHGLNKVYWNELLPTNPKELLMWIRAKDRAYSK